MAAPQAARYRDFVKSRNWEMKQSNVAPARLDDHRALRISHSLRIFSVSSMG